MLLLTISGSNCLQHSQNHVQRNFLSSVRTHDRWQKSCTASAPSVQVDLSFFPLQAASFSTSCLRKGIRLINWSMSLMINLNYKTTKTSSTNCGALESGPHFPTISTLNRWKTELSWRTQEGELRRKAHEWPAMAVVWLQLAHSAVVFMVKSARLDRRRKLAKRGGRAAHAEAEADAGPTTSRN